MAKKIVIISAISCIILFLVSCLSTESTPKRVKPSAKFIVDVKAETENELVVVTLSPFWGERETSILGVETDPAGFRYFELNVQNNTTEIVKVVWEKSSINYNGNSYPPFIEGQKFADSSKPMTPSMIAGGGYLSKEIYSSSQVGYASGEYGGWYTDPITSSDVIIIICLDSKGVENYYTISIKRDYGEESAPEGNSDDAVEVY